MIEFKLKPTNTNLIMFAVLISVVLLVFPLLIIWSLNTLFPVLAIAYTLETWFAALIISTLFKSIISRGS